jgi:hypothetical protein
LSRNKRAAKAVDMRALAGIATDGEGPRKIWDSQNTWLQRKVKVRDEGGPSTGDTAVDNAYRFTGITRNFWREFLNRNSYDNLGSELHYHLSIDDGQRQHNLDMTDRTTPAGFRPLLQFLQKMAIEQKQTTD